MKKNFRNLLLVTFVSLLSCFTVQACETCAEHEVTYLSAVDYTSVHTKDGDISEVALYNLRYASKELKENLREEIIKDHDNYHSEFLKTPMGENSSREEITDIYTEFLPEVEEVTYDEPVVEETVYEESAQDENADVIIDVEYNGSPNPNATPFNLDAHVDGLISYLMDYKYDDSLYEDYFVETVGYELSDMTSIQKTLIEPGIYMIAGTNDLQTYMVGAVYDNNTQQCIGVNILVDSTVYDTDVYHVYEVNTYPGQYGEDNYYYYTRDGKSFSIGKDGDYLDIFVTR